MRKQWRLPAALVLLSAIPTAGGVVRTTELAAGAEVTEANARFFAAPVPVLLHIVGATVFCLVGAFQFVPSLRGRRSRWHRLSGRVVVPCGLLAAVTALWMTLFYPHGPADSYLLSAFRIVFGALMLAALLLGLAAIRRRDFTTHRAWMIRAYAVAIGAGTQVLTLGPWMAIAGPPGKLAHALLMAAGWVINLAVAEHYIRRSTRKRATGDHQRPTALTPNATSGR